MLRDNEDQSLNADIAALVKRLPEIYQPVYGYPELSACACRQSQDRLEYIEKTYQLLAAKLNRPLRVLDLGCAQGFFSLNLAKQGASVLGIDFCDENVELCKALAEKNPNFDARFHAGLVEEVIDGLHPQQFDLVLGLSVFHHLVHRLGAASVQKMLAVLADTVSVGIYEMALAIEPVYWAASQPKNPRDLMQGYAFVHECARIASHLSAAQRPLYIASNHYWFLNGQVGAFDRWQAESHAYTKNTNNNTRRYFFGEGIVVKTYTLDDADYCDVNLREYKNATAFLEHPPAGASVSRLFLYGQHASEVWWAHDYWPGELLLDKILNKQPYDAGLIVRDVLDQLALWGKAGLYHNDLRVSNIIVQDDGHARVIDFGAISSEKKDGGWPYNLFLSFMIFVHDVVHKNATMAYPIRSAAFNPENFPEPYRTVLWKLFETVPDQWSFALLSDLIARPQQNLSLPDAARASVATVMQAIESACRVQLNAAVYWRQIAEKNK